MVGELAPGGRVEVRRRLVEHEQLGLHREHRGHRHPPALPEAEVVRRAVDVLGHVDAGERRAAPGRRARHPAARRWPDRRRRRRAPSA